MDAHVRDLRYFIAVAEELSFTRAAHDRLFISQPALSKQIRQLEITLRTKLFERDKRNVRLTAPGRALLPHAKRIVEQWETAQQAVFAANKRNTLAVGFQTRIGRGLIPSVAATMTESLPDWTLSFCQVSWNDPVAGLGTECVDVAIAWLPVPEGGDFSWKVISTEERWVALSPSHRLADRPVIEFAELAQEAFIALPSAAGAQRNFWLANDFRRSPALVSGEAATAEETFEAVAAGIGVALLSSGNACMYKRDDVVFRPVSGLSPSELAVVWRSSDEREAVRVFVDAAVEFQTVEFQTVELQG
jgi:DNA-binding transcriptional LysR family regulator